MNIYNIGQTLADTAARRPDQLAIAFPDGRDGNGKLKHVEINFKALNQLCDQYAHGFSEYGIYRGQRVLMLLRPNIDFIAVVFALLKIGAVPILIDPGMGMKSFRQCVSETEATAMIGIPIGHVLRIVFRNSFKTIKTFVTAGRRWFWGGTTLEAVKFDNKTPFQAADTHPKDEAAIAFTSGSTGIPKGVVYRHGIFREQIRILSQEVGIKEGEVLLAGLAILALFNPAMGVTTIMPDMDPSAPAKLKPAGLIEAMQQYNVTASLGSPTIFKILGDYCDANSIKLPDLKHVFMFGAAVPPSLIGQFSEVMPNGKVYTPFGATEALPITSIGEGEILAETGALTEEGAGVCVGRPLGDAKMCIIPITDKPISTWDDNLILPQGNLGEVVVKGSVVTDLYLNRPQKTAEAKIYEGDEVWHRMGDIGYFDVKGRLWICGRKSHRVETADGLMLTVQCEAIFNQHIKVKRTALIGLGTYGQQKPVLVVEMEPDKKDTAKNKIIQELRDIGAKHEHTQSIQDFLFHDSFPVDVRHNAKIQREKLTVWATEQLK